MLFKVIFCVDVPVGFFIMAYAPPHCDELWNQTEDDSNYDMSRNLKFLDESVCIGELFLGHHRKWCALLNRKQFDEFVSHCELVADDVQTGRPIICFTSTDDDVIQIAYVTPIPRRTGTKRDWQRVRSAILSIYG